MTSLLIVVNNNSDPINIYWVWDNNSNYIAFRIRNFKHVEKTATLTSKKKKNSSVTFKLTFHSKEDKYIASSFPSSVVRMEKDLHGVHCAILWSDSITH